MKKVIKDIKVNENGELYCFNLNRKLKQRLVLASQIENTQQNGYATVPVLVEDKGVGVFKFNQEEMNFLMDMVKKQRKINAQKRETENRTSEFRKGLAIEENNKPNQYQMYTEGQYENRNYNDMER